MKRKGKPKAKTRVQPPGGQVASEASPKSGHSAGAGRQLDFGYNNPLIAISEAPASSRSATSCASSLWSVRSQQAIDESDGDSVQSRLSEAPARRQKDPGHEQCDSRQPEASATQVPDIESVRRGYLQLVAYNNLQYFYLGALLFAVINVILLLIQIVAHKLQAAPISAPPHSNSTGHVQGQGGCGRQQLGEQLAWTLVAVELPLALLLAVIFALKIIEFNSVVRQLEGEHSKGLSSVAGSKQCRKLIGIALATVILAAPAGVARWQHCQAEGQAATMATIVYVLPLVLSKIPTRFQLANTLLYLGVALPIVLISVSDYLASARHTSAANASAATLILVLAGLFGGQLRRRQLVRMCARSTFKGASELIEAKVSLEQQRQQQETLLLSVLPAYVAEQVKRTMVKKMESLDEPATAGSPGGGQPSETNYCQVIVSNTASVATQTFGAAQVRSLTLPDGGDRLAPPGGEGRPRSSSVARRSFARFSSLGSSLASGAACLGGSLLAGVSAASANKSLVSTSTQVQAPSNSSALANSQPHSPLKASASSVSQAQAGCVAPQASAILSASQQQPQVRRGFNELYIRTYNNVSLLYGDIVGFTSLCTQLSSSQLVRVLNNLFSHFDHLADQHRIMRIKILGDCYYGVSGIPEFAVMGAKSASHPRAALAGGHEHDNHAINCVNMGLDMISYIKCLNIERESPPPRSSTSDKPLAAGMEQPAAPTPMASPLPAHFELNMRIGIHTGHIHSGVIGLKKWQFDVWSNDVSIAMHCESSGVAGRVQVTEATIAHLHDAFTFEPAPSTSETGPRCGHRRDSFLTDKNIRTYLIGQRRNEHSPATSVARDKFAKGAAPAGGELAMDEGRIRAATIGTIRQTLLSGELHNVSFMSASGLAFEHNDMRGASLGFRDSLREQQFASSRVSLASALLELLLLFALLPVALILGIDRSLLRGDAATKTIFALAALSTGLMALIGVRLLTRSTRANSNGRRAHASKHNGAAEKRTSSSVQVTLSSHSKAGPESSLVGELRCAKTAPGQLNPLRLVYERCVSHKKTTREVASRGLSAWLLGTLSLALIAGQLYLVARAVCHQERDWSQRRALYQSTVIIIVIALDLSKVLLSYPLKSMILLLLCAGQLARVLLALAPQADVSSALKFLCPARAIGSLPSSNFTQPFPADGSDEVLLLVLIIWSLVHVRQLEYSARCNFLWRNRLNVDHEELEYISGINKVLLENILPSHVVQHYLESASERQPDQERVAHSAHESQSDQRLARGGDYNQLVRMSIGNMRKYLNQQRQLECDELYHEQHAGVAVMFASIPHFYEFYDESDISKQGLGCIALLNEIICDFDKLLLKNKFSRIEKIKTIGSTYMAAAGLRPTSAAGGHSPLSARAWPEAALEQQARLSTSQQKMNLIGMIQFATSLMSALNGINKQSFQVFKLRVGVNTGPVIAGIIGAQRPFYDIWGDCVNIASRMESLGEVGRIQVEERTAKLLLECLCAETYAISRRGRVEVKGKGGMVTYFVDKKQSVGSQAQSSASASVAQSPQNPPAGLQGQLGRQSASAAATTREQTLSSRESLDERRSSCS